jgi:hypothetical protein
LEEVARRTDLPSSKNHVVTVKHPLSISQQQSGIRSIEAHRPGFQITLAPAVSDTLQTDLQATGTRSRDRMMLGDPAGTTIAQRARQIDSPPGSKTAFWIQ